MKGLPADCRHALRLYLRTPGASLIAVSVLAVGMAFVGAFLSLYVDLVLRPEPALEQSRQIATTGQNGGPSLFGLPIEVVDRMTEEMNSIEAVGFARNANVLVGPDREQSVVALASTYFFETLRPRLALGRGIAPEENRPDAEPVVVISYRLWQDRFGGDPDVIGAEIAIAHDPAAPFLVPSQATFTFSAGTPDAETTLFRIVGVMPDALPSEVSANADTWVALERGLTLFYGTREMRRFASGTTFVRKRAGVSAAAVADELTARYSDYEFLATNYYPDIWLDAIDGIVDDITAKRNAERQLEIFLAGSTLLALVAAGNVSLFLLARAPGRRRELAVRMAVGAPFGRIARQLATEAGLLVVVSAALGLLFSIWLNAYLRSLTILSAADWRDVSLFDWKVLGLSGIFVVVLTLLISLAPLAGVRRLGVGATSRQTTARATPMQRMTGAVQIAAAGALGGAAIAFAWYLGDLLLRHPGYEIPDRYVVQFGRADMPNDATLESYFVELARRRAVIEAIPGVEAVGFGRPVPGVEPQIVNLVRIDLPDDPTQSVGASSGVLDAEFLDVLGLRIVHGRAPAGGDSFESAGPDILVNQAFANAVWGRDDVVGERLDNSRVPNGWSNAEVIGVLADISFGHPSGAALPYVFLGADRFMGRSAVVQTSMRAADLRSALENLVSSGQLEVQINEVLPLRAALNAAVATDRGRAVLAMVAATLVVLLTAFGYYGTQRYLVAAGRREYAIRAALGAGPRSLGRLVVLRALLSSAPSLVVGALLAFIAVAWLRADYLGDRISPALVSVAVAVALGLLLIASCLGPAREAMQTQPARLLRED